MADHMQQQVLDALVDILQGAETSAGESVFLDRIDNLEPADLPAILIEESPDGEAIEPSTVSDVQKRTLTVTVRCVLSVAANTASAARAFGLEVERAMRTTDARTALAAVSSANAITRSRLDQFTQGDRTYAQRVQDWTFTYFTRRGTPDAKA